MGNRVQRPRSLPPLTLAPYLAVAIAATAARIVSPRPGRSDRDRRWLVPPVARSYAIPLEPDRPDSARTPSEVGVSSRAAADGSPPAAADDPWDAYLATDSLLEDLPARSARFGMIRVGAQGFQLVFLAAVGMALARLLTPADFGIWAMVLTLTTFVDTFRDFGLPMAAIHREGLRHEDLSHLFWLTQRLNVATVAVIAILAPVITRLYSQPALTHPTLVAAAAILCQGLALQHESVLVRRMRFGEVTAIETGSVLLGGGVGLALGASGFGYWALVFQFATTAAARSVAMWLASGWMPSRPRRGQAGATGLAALLGYGAHYTGYRIVQHIGSRLDRVVIALHAPSRMVGIYDNAFRWSRYPIRLAFPPVLSVAVAGLSRIQNDPRSYRTSSRRAILPVLTVVVPALTFGALEAHGLVPLLLGDQWLGAVPYLRLFALAGIASSLVMITHWLYLSSGQTRRQLLWALIYTPIMIGAVLLGARGGALGIARAFTVATWVLAVPAILFCLRTSHVTAGDFLAASWRPLVATAAAALVLLALGPFSPAGRPLLDLTAAFTVFVAVYGGVWRLAPGGRAALHELTLMRRALGGGRGPGGAEAPPATPTGP